MKKKKLKRKIRKLVKRNLKLESDIANAECFAYNMLPGRTLLDQRDTLDEQLQLLDEFLKTVQRFELNWPK